MIIDNHLEMEKSVTQELSATSSPDKITFESHKSLLTGEGNYLKYRQTLLQWWFNTKYRSVLSNLECR